MTYEIKHRKFGVIYGEVDISDVAAILASATPGKRFFTHAYRLYIYIYIILFLLLLCQIQPPHHLGNLWGACRTPSQRTP